MPTPGPAEVLPATRQGSPAGAGRAIVTRPERQGGGGSIGGYSFPQIETLANHAARANMFPGLNPSQAVMKIVAGLELGLPISTALSQIDVIDGRTAMESNLMASMIKRHPFYRYRVTEWDDTVCTIKWEERDPETGEWFAPGPPTSFTLDDAKRAELTTNPKKINWKRYPKAMLFARALAQGARAYCGDALSNVYVPDELDTPEDRAESEYRAHAEKIAGPARAAAHEAGIDPDSIVDVEELGPDDDPPKRAPGEAPDRAAPDPRANTGAGAPAPAEPDPRDPGNGEPATADEHGSDAPSKSRRRPAPAPSELDRIGVKPMSSTRVTGDQARALRKAAEPLTVDELLVVIAWSNRRERWPVLAMNELDVTRWQELYDYLQAHPHGSKGRAALIRAVAEWTKTNDSAAAAAKDLAGDTAEGKGSGNAEPGDDQGRLV